MSGEEPDPASPQDQTRRKFQDWVGRNLTILVVAVLVAIVAAIAIATNPEYPSPGSKVGNAIGAALFFGLVSFGVGKFIRFTRQRSKVGTSTGTVKEELKQFALFSSDGISPREQVIPVYSEVTPAEESQMSDIATLSLSDLHPWVSEVAIRYWDNGDYRGAVEHAARSVSHETKGKIWSYSDGTELMNQAFSMNSKPGSSPQRRLRFPGNPREDTWRNRMRAARSLGEACFAGVRNVAAHERDLNWSKSMAFQYLAMFSVLAHWIDECDVVDD